MKKYYQTYNETDKKIDYLKYGILNNFGPNIDRCPKEEYNEEKITKIK